MIKRYCIFCGTKLNPFNKNTFTGHEYECAVKNRKSIPEWLVKTVAAIDNWAKRSEVAKSAAKKRVKKNVNTNR